MKAVWKLIAVMVAWTCAPAIALAQAAAGPVLLVRMPHEAPVGPPPTEADVARFVAARGRSLHMTPPDLLRDLRLAREVLGQRRVFDDLAQFEAQSGIPANVRFISWAEALRFFADYVSDPNNPPVVAQLGDTWAAYFRSLGVVPYERRHSWDVRVLWYWKDLVRPEEISTGDGFVAVCQRLHDAPPPGLIAPFAIPTAPVWDLLHDLSIWAYNAGLPSLISTDKKLGLFPWKEAVFGGAEGERAARFLITLAKRGYVALPERLGTELGEEFLSRKYAMVILGAWVAGRAEHQLGPGWESRIGVTFPPSIGAPEATTLKGGSVMVVLDPTRGRNAAGVDRARRLLDFLCSFDSQQRYAQGLGDLAADPRVLAQSPHINLFKPALERGRLHPHIPEWAPLVENLATRDNLYAFWKRLAALAGTPAATEQASQADRERLILAALHSAEADINRELSPGKLSFLWPWLVAVVLPLAALTGVSVWRRRVEHRRAEERLRASEARYRDLYENAPDMFCSVEADTGRIIECNQTLVTKTGYTKDEVLQRTIYDLYHPDCLEEVEKAVEAFRQTGHLRDLELQLKCRDGSKLWVSVNVSAVRDGQGRILRSRSIWRDITQRKRAEEELRQKRRELAHIARVVTMGELAASLAHELNQPLAAIVSNAQASQRLIAGQTPDWGEVREALTDIAEDAKRAGDVIRRLRDLMKKNEVERVPLDMNQVIQEVIVLLRGSVLRDISVAFDLAEGLPPVVGDRIQLQQVVLNLLLNASEAMGHLPPESRELVVRTAQENAGAVTVSVRDSGAGLDQATKDRIFDAFFTTKAGGMGMGLSISRSIIEAHGGRLWAMPPPDGGAAFHFTVPAKDITT
jgi:PAS domain S-box-containing protein